MRGGKVCCQIVSGRITLSDVEREEKWEHREIGYLILQHISLLDALVVALLRSLPCVSTRITAPTTTFMEQENKMMKVLVWFTVEESTRICS
jgi:hypothetical protein